MLFRPKGPARVVVFPDASKGDLVGKRKPVVGYDLLLRPENEWSYDGPSQLWDWRGAKSTRISKSSLVSRVSPVRGTVRKRTPDTSLMSRDAAAIYDASRPRAERLEANRRVQECLARRRALEPCIPRKHAFTQHHAFARPPRAAD